MAVRAAAVSLKFKGAFRLNHIKAALFLPIILALQFVSRRPRDTLRGIYLAKAAATYMDIHVYVVFSTGYPAVQRT